MGEDKGGGERVNIALTLTLSRKGRGDWEILKVSFPLDGGELRC